MQEVLLEEYTNGQQVFIIKDGQKKLGEMVIAISGDLMTVYHTEVFGEAEGKGLGTDLLNAMVDHARKFNLKVIPLCVFVLAQFKRHPGLYEDVWQKK